MIRVEITDKRKQAFCRWLVSRGAELLAPSTAYEIARFRCADGVSVVAATAKGDLYFSGNGYHIWDCYLKGSAWRAFPKGKREDKKGRSRLMATVALRDGENCFYCHKPLHEDRSLEHLLSITFGGSNHLANLVLAHKECNEAAGNKSVREKLRIHIDNLGEKHGTS